MARNVECQQTPRRRGCVGRSEMCVSGNRRMNVEGRLSSASFALTGQRPKDRSTFVPCDAAFPTTQAHPARPPAARSQRRMVQLTRPSAMRRGKLPGRHSHCCQSGHAGMNGRMNAPESTRLLVLFILSWLCTRETQPSACVPYRAVATRRVDGARSALADAPIPARDCIRTLKPSKIPI